MANLATRVELTGSGDPPGRIAEPSDALYLAAMMLIGRLYYRGDSPLGIAGGFDLGALYVRSRDPDVTALLRGRRGRTVSPYQDWPTVATVRDRWRIETDVADERIAEVIAAVTENLKTSLRRFGIA